MATESSTTSSLQESAEDADLDIARRGLMVKQISLPASFPEHGSRPLLAKVSSDARLYELKKEARWCEQQQQPWGKVRLGGSSSVTDLARLAAEISEAEAAAATTTPCAIFPGACNCRIRCGEGGAAAAAAEAAVTQIWMGKVTAGEAGCGDALQHHAHVQVESGGGQAHDGPHGEAYGHPHRGTGVSKSRLAVGSARTIQAHVLASGRGGSGALSPGGARCTGDAMVVPAGFPIVDMGGHVDTPGTVASSAVVAPVPAAPSQGALKARGCDGVDGSPVTVTSCGEPPGGAVAVVDGPVHHQKMGDGAVPGMESKAGAPGHHRSSSTAAEAASAALAESEASSEGSPSHHGGFNSIGGGTPHAPLGVYATARPAYPTSGSHGIVPGNISGSAHRFPSSIRRLRRRSLMPTPLMRVAAVGKMLAQPLAVLDALLLAEGTSGPTAERLAEMRRMLTFIQGYCCDSKPVPGDTTPKSGKSPRAALYLKPTRTSHTGHGPYGSPTAVASAREVLARRPRISLDAALDTGIPDSHTHAGSGPKLGLEDLAYEEAAACLALWGMAPPAYVASPAAASLTEDAEVRNWLETNFGMQHRRKPTPTNRSSVEMLKAENKKRRPSMTGELAGAGRPLVDNSGRTESSHYFKAALLRLGSWNFDSFRLDRATKGHPLVAVMVELLHKERLVDKFNLDDAKVVRYFTAVEQSMEAYSNPFHNRIHVADVVVSLYHLIIGPDVAQYLKPLHVLGALIAAAVHDFGHKGRTNDFLAKVDDPLALRYNLRSVNESMHVSEAIKLLLKPENNFLSALKPEDMLALRTLIVDLVLATDLSKHFRFVDLLKARATVGGNGAGGAASGGAGGGAGAAGAATGPPFNASIPTDVTLVLQLALKCSDLGHSSKSLNIHLKWTLAMEEEFYRQGDEERRRGMAISPFMDRQKPDGVVKSQASFFHFVSLPLYQAWSSVFPRSATILDGCRRNLAFWESSDSLSHFRNGDWMAKHVPHNFAVTRDEATGAMIASGPPADSAPAANTSHHVASFHPSDDASASSTRPNHVVPFPVQLHHGGGGHLGSSSPLMGNGSPHVGNGHGHGAHVACASPLSVSSGRSGTSDTLSQLLRSRQQQLAQPEEDGNDDDDDRMMGANGADLDTVAEMLTETAHRGALHGGVALHGSLQAMVCGGGQQVVRTGSPFLLRAPGAGTVPLSSLTAAGGAPGSTLPLHGKHFGLGACASGRPGSHSHLRAAVISESPSPSPESDSTTSNGSMDAPSWSALEGFLSSDNSGNSTPNLSGSNRRHHHGASRLRAAGGGALGGLNSNGGGELDLSNSRLLKNASSDAFLMSSATGPLVPTSMLARDRSFSYPPPEGPDRGSMGASPVAGGTGHGLVRGAVLQYLPQTLQAAGGALQAPGLVQWGGPVNMDQAQGDRAGGSSAPGTLQGVDRSRSEQTLTTYSRALLVAAAQQAAASTGASVSGPQQMRRVLGSLGTCTRLRHADGCCEYADAEDNLVIAQRFRRSRSRSVSDQG